MKNLASDIWQELRERRLWPIAVALLAGLVAVPVLLAKPYVAPAPEPAPAQPAGEVKKEEDALLAQVKLGEDAPGTGSLLGVFNPSDPFEPPRRAVDKAEEELALEEGAELGLELGGSGGGQPAGAPEEDVVIESDDVIIEEPASPEQPKQPEKPDKPEETTTVYQYVVDLTFEANGEVRRMKGLKKLDVLPSQATPLLIFMGVTAQGAEAVFLVDSTLQAAGEGRCTPSQAECGFAYVGAGSEFNFTNEQGDSYRLLIDEIRKVKVKPGAEAAGRAKGATAGASVGSQRSVIPPPLADEVVVVRKSLGGAPDKTDHRQEG